MFKDNKKILLINFLIALVPSALLLFSELFSLNSTLLAFVLLSFLVAGTSSGFLFSIKYKLNLLAIIKLAFLNGLLFGFSSIILNIFNPLAEKIATKTIVSVYIGMSAANESNIYIYLAKSSVKFFFWVTLFFTITSFIGIYVRNKIDMRNLEK